MDAASQNDLVVACRGQRMMCGRGRQNKGTYKYANSNAFSRLQIYYLTVCESKSASEQDSVAGNRSLQHVPVNLPATDFHSTNTTPCKMWVTLKQRLLVRFVYIAAEELAAFIAILLFILMLNEAILNGLCCL